MRVLFATVAHPTHFLQIVPYAQAFQNAGHEVCVAAPPGAENEIAAAGLATVAGGEHVPHSLPNLQKHGVLPDQEVRAAYAEALGLDAEECDRWDVFYQYFAFNARFTLPSEPRADLDNLVTFAQSWKPDLVIWESWFPMGGIIARACGAAHARLLLGPDYGGWSMALFAERGARAAHIGGNPLVDAVRPAARRYGLEPDEDLLLGQATIDPLPTELRLAHRTKTLPVCGIPYQGGGVMPEWLQHEPERPRVALSLGLSIRLYVQGGDPRVPKIFEAVEDMDIELVATLSEAQLESVSRVPDNVRIVDYVPLTQLLPSCQALIYHGAGGTFRAAQAAGVPQLMIDTNEPHRMLFSGEGENLTVSNAERHQDSRFCSQFIVDRRAGLRIDHQTQSPAEIRARLHSLLTNPVYRRGAAELRHEWQSRPLPSDLIPALTRLAADR